MHVGLLSGQVFCPFGELWLVGSHGAALLSGMYAATEQISASSQQSELEVAALTKAVW